MNLLVATQRIRHGCAVPREGRRIEDDQIKSRDDALVRLDGGVFLEPVKNIDGAEGKFFREAVGGGVALGGFNRVLTLIEHVDVRRARAGRVQTEAAQKAETIQHLSTFGEL